MKKHYWSQLATKYWSKSGRLSADEFHAQIDRCSDKKLARQRVDKVVARYNALCENPNVPETCKAHASHFLREMPFFGVLGDLEDNTHAQSLNKDCTRSFCSWLVVSAIWPDEKMTKEIAAKMCIWWGVEFSAFIPLFPLPDPDDIREYERLFEGRGWEEIEWKGLQHTRQQQSVSAVSTATPILDKKASTFRPQQVSRDENSSLLTASSDLDTVTAGASSGHPTTRNIMEKPKTTANTELTTPSNNQGSSSRQAISYHEQRVRKLESQLKKAKDDQERAKKVAWHEGQAESFKKQYEYHTRKAKGLSAEMEDQGRTPKRQRTT
ncbi:hypothetical protein FGRMN_8894 [Fusarium graminum]|nr:hypothetical protein FGRMN_8894 [Fusarium graminum]